MPAQELNGRSPEEPQRRARRRSFTAEYKLFIVKEAAACKKKGELGALLKREGLYASHLAAFRSATSRGTFATEARTPRRRSVQALMLQLAQKERELARWKRRAERAEAMVRFQKKNLELSVTQPRSGARSWSSSQS
jgi:hypothetical protein